MIKINAVVSSTVAGVVAGMVSYHVLISPVTLAALAVRRAMPEAWFSSAIVWYAAAASLVVSAVVAVIVWRILYRKLGGWPGL